MPPTLANNPNIYPALAAMILLVVGCFLRGAWPRWAWKRLLVGAAGAAALGAVFWLVLLGARDTSFTPAGALPCFQALTAAATEQAQGLRIFLVNHQNLLIAWGTLALAAVGAGGLIRRRPAVFWFCLSVATGLRAEMMVSEVRGTPARWLYLGAILACLLGTIRNRPDPEPGEREAAWRYGGRSFLLSLLVLLSLGLGFHRLDRAPRLDQFESTNALVAVQLNEGDGATRDMIWSYFPRSYGADSSSSAFFSIPAAFIMKLGGANLVAFRAWSVLAGVLGTIFLYILARNLVGTAGALIAAFLFSISPWQLGLARAGMFGSLSIAYTLLGLILLLNAIRHERVILYLLLGFYWSFYGFCYLPVKLAMPLIVAVLAHRTLFYRGFLRRNWPGMAAFAAIFVVFFGIQAGNLGLVADTAYTSSKQGSIYPFIGSTTRADLSVRWELVPGQLLQNLDVLYVNLCSSRSTGSFTYTPKGGLLNRAVLMLALLGLGWALANLHRTRGMLLLGWLVPALAPFLILVTPIGSPPRHLLLGIPLVALLAGAFLAETGRAVLKMFPARFKVIPLAALTLTGAALLGSLAAFNVSRYFSAEEPDLTATGRFVGDLIARGYRASLHLHPERQRLEPARRIDFLSYPVLGDIYRKHTNIRQYYEYSEIKSDPWRQYFAGPGRIASSLAEAIESGQAVAVIVDPANQKALRAAAEDLGHGENVGCLTGLDGETAAYYYLVEGHPRRPRRAPDED